jgi:hypothetical protein
MRLAARMHLRDVAPLEGATRTKEAQFLRGAGHHEDVARDRTRQFMKVHVASS